MDLTQRFTLSRSQHWRCVAAVVIFLLYTLTSFGIYCARTLHGDVANHILAGEMFGTPAELKARGVKPLYTGPGVTGWDGQFYYYISNDVLGRKDTAAHIDAPSYRYQRVGMSLYAKTLATLTGQDWVSPAFFFTSYLLLILVATWVGSRLLARFGASPLLILLWSLSIGTQITMFNALPDASADAFLILALAALLSGRTALSAIPFAMAALSREVYALFPALIVLFTLIDGALARRSAAGWGAAIVGMLRPRQAIWWLVVPCLVAVTWQAYVIHHFKVRPSEQALGILGAPLASWYAHVVSGLQLKHLFVGSSNAAYMEAVTLIFFFLVLVVSVAIGARILRSGIALKVPSPLRGVAATAIAFALLYACFGQVVMMHYTGYFKAIAVYFFLVPLLLYAAPPRRWQMRMVLALLSLAVLFTTVYNLHTRILPRGSGGEQYTRMATVTETRSFQCFTGYSASIKVNSVVVEEGSWLMRLFGARPAMIVNVDLTNTSTDTFITTKGGGSVNMGYHWVDANNQVVVDGDRSAIPGPLLPGQTANVDVYALYPSNVRGTLSLKLSPVQEGCAWFYGANPAVSDGFKYVIKR